MDIDLSGRIALVTGAGSGLGMSSAISLAQSGATLVLWGRTESKLAEVGSKILDMGRACHWYSVDVTEFELINDNVKKILDRHGRIDILINSAGTNIPQNAELVTYEAWDSIMNINAKGLFFCCQAVAQQSMIPNRRGSIINISSQSGQVALPKRAVYCASKGAVDQLTRVMALEWAEYNIRVNAVAPTFVKTPLTEKMLEDKNFSEYVLGNIPMKRLATPEDVANVVCFLASDKSAMITGAIIPVDGGWTIH